MLQKRGAASKEVGFTPQAGVGTVLGSEGIIEEVDLQDMVLFN